MFVGNNKRGWTTVHPFFTSLALSFDNQKRSIFKNGILLTIANQFFGIFKNE
jgi:hypothetical protein